MEFSLLIVTLFPSGLTTFFYLLRMLIRNLRQNASTLTSGGISGQHYLVLYVMTLVVIFGLDLIVFDLNLTFFPVDVITASLLVIFGAMIAFVFEFLLSLALVLVKRMKMSLTKKPVVSVSSSQKNHVITTTNLSTRSSTSRMLSTVLLLLVPVLEEIIFRGILFSVFNGVNVFIILIVSSGAFALTHVTFGFRTLMQKFLAGLVLGVAFILGDFVLLVPILIHLIENQLIMLYMQFQMRSRQGQRMG